MKIGDTVLVLDDNISGEVAAINGEEITVKLPDGFCFQFQKKELVVMDASVPEKEFLKMDLGAVLSEKAVPETRTASKTHSKNKKLPPMEVDLHIHHLTAAKNLSNYEMLTLQVEEARRQLEFAIKKRISRVVFIHGVGEGVLRAELEYLFGRYDNVEFYDADFQKYGRGATEVYIYQNSSRPESF